jgi:serine/threonine protein kinase
VEIDPQLPQPGALIAEKYRIERVLGVGGMGIVYGAKHELMNQEVALKLLLPDVAKDKEAVARFLHEGRATARLNSPHVVRVMDVGMEGAAPFLAMELLAGRDLGQILERQGPFKITETVDYLIEAIEGLSHAHAAGIIHRDLKPSNLFLAQGEDDVRAIKVVDFGISKSMGKDSGNLTATSAVLGSPAYMAPEQLRSSKHVDARVDVWSLGVIAFELLTGALPFTGETIGEIFANVLEKAPTRPSTLRVELPGKLEEAILKCLQKSPDARFANIAELAAAIARFGTGRCDALVAGIEKRFGAAGAVATPARSAAIPDLEVPAPRPSTPKVSAPPTSAPRVSAPPISAPSVGGAFDFDDEMLGPALVTVDEAKKASAKAAVATVMTRAPAPPPRAAVRDWLGPVALHLGIAVATVVLLRFVVSGPHPWDVLPLLPGTSEGAAASTTATVGGVFSVAALGCCVAAIASRTARWGFFLATLGLVVIAIGIFLVMGTATGGVVRVASGEGLFVSTGGAVAAAGLAIACLGKAHDAWTEDDARVLAPALAAVAGALFFVAMRLVF